MTVELCTTPAPKSEMLVTIGEESRLKRVVVDVWPFLAEFYRDRPWPSREAKIALEVLQREGIIDSQLTITHTWRAAIDEVGRGRRIDEFTEDDKALIVEAYWRLNFWPTNHSGQRSHQ